MKIPLGQKILGLSLIIISALGLLFSISGITAAWIIRPRIRASASELLASFEDALSTSQEGFSLMDQAIEDLLSDFEIIDESFNSLDTTLEGVSGTLDTTANLIGDDLKQMLIDTQTGLSAAATTAELIDNTLSFLSRIPLLGVDYAPEVPLHISLEQVADNLDDFPDTFQTIEEDINVTNDGMGALQTNLVDLSDQIHAFTNDLENAQTVLRKFNDSIDVIVTRLRSLNDNLSIYLTFSILFISGMLFWIGISQLNVLRLGLIYLKGETFVLNLLETQKK